MNHNESTCHCHCLRGYVTYRYVIKCCVSYFPHPILRSLNVLRRGGHIYLDDDPTWEGRKLQDLPACLCTLHNSIPYCTQLFPLLHSLFFARPVLVIIGMVGVPFNPSMAAEAALPGHPLIPFCPRCSFSKDHRP